MKDKQGIIRGKCTTPGCECNEYTAPQDTKGVRCDYCDHVPVKHLKMIKLGACSCGECDSYESEDPWSYTKCGYCDCPAQRHKGAEQLITPVPQPAPPPKFPTQMMPAADTGQRTGSLPASMPPSGAMAPGVVPKCKIPNCAKPCFVEKNGRVHEFCGRGHAELYRKNMTQQAPKMVLQPMTYKQPATTAVLYKPPSSPSATRRAMMVTSQPQQPPPGSPQVVPMAAPPAPAKVCEKCQIYPANPNRKWCQSCFAQKS